MGVESDTFILAACANTPFLTFPHDWGKKLKHIFLMSVHSPSMSQELL